MKGSRSSVVERKNRFRSRSLAAAAGLLTSSSLGNDANATIIIPNPPNDASLIAVPGDSISLDGTGAGTFSLTTMTDVMGKLELAFSSMGGSTLEFVTQNGGTGMGRGNYLIPVTDPTVDDSLNYTGQALMVKDSQNNPFWTPGVSELMGFRFTPDSGPSPVYGWMEVSFEQDPSSFTVLQWAYDDTGNPITLGVIPEPGTALLLALGLTGLAAGVRWTNPNRSRGDR